MSSKKKVAIKTELAPLPVACYSQAIRADDTLYVQGMIALEPGKKTLVTGGITKQTEQVFQNISAILSAAGMALRHIVRLTVFLRDMKDFQAFNEIYNRCFASVDPPPVRTAVQVAGLPLDALVEVEVTAIGD